MARGAIIASILCTLVPIVAYACQCVSLKHPQEYFCDADYVIIARVIDKEFENVGFNPSETLNSVPVAQPVQSIEQHPEHPLADISPQFINVDPNYVFEDRQHPTINVQLNEISFGSFPFLQKVMAPPTESPIQEYPFPSVRVHDDPFSFPFYPSQNQKLRYIVLVEKIFKGEVLRSEKLIIHTDGSDALCGVTHLEVGKKYLISGYKDEEGKNHIHTCNWVEETRYLTKSIRRGLRHFYIKYCDVCKITRAIYFKPSYKEPNECVYNRLHQRHCEDRFSSCILRPNGKCGWYKGKDYKMCKKGVELRSSNNNK